MFPFVFTSFARENTFSGSLIACMFQFRGESSYHIQSVPFQFHKFSQACERVLKSVINTLNAAHTVFTVITTSSEKFAELFESVHILYSG